MKDKKLRHWHRKKGFALVELMIVVAIVGLLAMLAVPSYQSYIMKSHRYEAIASLMNIQMAEEKWRTNNASYGTIAQVWGGVTATEGGHYNLQIYNISATSYIITAIAEGGQAKDTERDTVCTKLALTVDGTTTTQTPAACWNL